MDAESVIRAVQARAPQIPSVRASVQNPVEVRFRELHWQVRFNAVQAIWDLPNFVPVQTRRPCRAAGA